MNRKDDFDDTLAAWLRRQAPDQAPDRVLEGALDRAASMPQRRSWRQRLSGGTRMTLFTRIAAVGAVVALAAVVGLQLSNLPGPNVATSPSATPSGSAAPSPVGTPTGTPVPSQPVDPEVAELVVRLDSGTDIGFFHALTVLADGRVITNAGEGESPFVVRQLTPEGVELIRDELAGSPYVTETATYVPVSLPGVEPPARGVAGHALEVGLPGGEVAYVDWVAVAGDEDLYYQPSPERESLDSVAARLSTIDEWLPESAWADRQAEPYVAPRHRVWILSQEWGGDPQDLPADIADLAWPFAGTILEYGQDKNTSEDPFFVARCGVVDDGARQQLLSALQEVGAERADRTWETYQLGDRESSRLMQVVLEPIFPDETSCDRAALPPV
jgi:hypothetical protein